MFRFRQIYIKKILRQNKYDAKFHKLQQIQPWTVENEANISRGYILDFDRFHENILRFSFEKEYDWLGYGQHGRAHIETDCASNLGYNLFEVLSNVETCLPRRRNIL